MSALEILREATRLGVRLGMMDGAITAIPPGRLPDDLRARIAESKPALLELLATPGKTAREAWAGTVDEVADRWDAHANKARSRGREPQWFDDTQLSTILGEAIKATTDAVTLAKALEGIDMWRDSWGRDLVKREETIRQGSLPRGGLLNILHPSIGPATSPRPRTAMSSLPALTRAFLSKSKSPQA